MTQPGDSQPLIQMDGVSFAYLADSDNPVEAITDVDLTVNEGERLALLGHNGSGKSTLGRLMNGLLKPAAGTVQVKGQDTSDEEHERDIFQTVGMVFQNPDSQIVATIVREDVAFGPENVGIPRDEMEDRIDEALELVDLEGFGGRAPHMLSAGQRQRVAIAGVLAMRPECIIFDEATSMLDPKGREDLMTIMDRLHRAGITIINITHLMSEAAAAERVVVLDGGEVVMDGPPQEVFTDVEKLQRYRLEVPEVAALAHRLNQHHGDFPTDVLRLDELEDGLRQTFPALYDGAEAEGAGESLGPYDTHTDPTAGGSDDGESGKAVDRSGAYLEAVGVSHVYMKGTPMEITAIEDVDFAAHEGETLAVIGHTGSGKSTLIQHFNGIFQSNTGSVTVGDHDVGSEELDLKALRRNVGLVFQRPENQLFEKLIGDDVAYGPLKLGYDFEEARERVQWAMKAVGLDFDTFVSRPIFALSGGQKRKVALAGVLAIQPQVLILDEPTAGLDPTAREELLDHIESLQAESGMTVVFVSHNMTEVATLADYVYVLKDGQNALDGPPREVFERSDELKSMGLGVPPVVELMGRLRRAGCPVRDMPLTVDEAVEVLLPLMSSQAS